MSDFAAPGASAFEAGLESPRGDRDLVAGLGDLAFGAGPNPAQYVSGKRGQGLRFHAASSSDHERWNLITRGLPHNDFGYRSFTIRGWIKQVGVNSDTGNNVISIDPVLAVVGP